METLLKEILTRLEHHEHTAARILNMVPSENSMSALAKLPMLLDGYHRYFFNDGATDDPWEFRGVEELASLETETAASVLRELSRAEFVNLRGLSGLNMMTVVLSALGGPPGSTVMLLARPQGGHYATESLAARLGLSVCHATGPDAHTVDLQRLEQTLRERQPGLVYLDQSNALFPLDVAAIAGVVRRSVKAAIVHVDASHWLGLVFGGQVANPLAEGADSFGGSTHKTFPGPQKAVFATNRGDLLQRLRATQHFMVSSHHFAATMSLALALLEFKHCGGAEYTAKIVENTRRLGAALDARGLHVAAKDRGYSAGHQLWVRTSPSGIDAFAASQRLFDAGIRTNAYPSLPGIPEPVLRVGVNEPTYHGLEGDDIDTVADVFADAVLGRSPAAQLADRVAALRARYHLRYRFPVDRPEILDQVLRIVRCALTERPAERATEQP